MKQFLLIFFIFVINFAFGQSSTELPVTFIPVYNNVPLKLETTYEINETDSLQIETFKCYLSNVKLFDGEKQVYAELDSYHLLNLSVAETMNFNLNIPENIAFSHLQFDLGIDSLTNMEGAMGGDLDPTKGMYWTWQSGYINFKLEGTSNLCDNRNNAFVFHLGGYAFPNNSIQTIRLKRRDEDKNQPVVIKMNLAAFLENIDLTTQSRVMSLGEQAIQLSEKASQIFSIVDEK
jgi:hypothetical protein